MSRPVRHVLMTADAVGGVWSYALTLARGLAARGVRTLLAVLGPAPDDDKLRDAKAIPGVTIETHEGALEWMNEPWADVEAAGRWLLALEDRVRPDIVHLNGYALGALPFRAPKLVVAHSCVCSWFSHTLGQEAPASFDAYRAAVRKGLEGARVVVAPTEAMRRALLVHHDVDGSLRTPTRVIFNAANPEAYLPRRKERLVFAAGRLWDEAKNMTVLEQAASGCPWPIVVAGSQRAPGGGTRSFTACKSLGLLPQDDMTWWMGRAAMFASPARYEPFGLSVLEAALSGCALVLADIESFRELWDGAATFVPSDDAQAWAKTLSRLAADDQAREALARAALLRARVYGPDRQADAYLGLYRELLSTAAPRATARLGETSCV